MTPKTTASITRLLKAWNTGNEPAAEQLWPAVFSQLQKLARRHLARERPDHTLESAALVNEVYTRLALGTKPECGSRVHFFAVCAKMMRQILVDHARARSSKKRGGNGERVSLSDAAIVSESNCLSLIQLDKALDRFTVKHPRKAKVVELKYFSGLSIDETAQALEVKPQTVSRDWEYARSWLLTAMNGENPDER